MRLWQTLARMEDLPRTALIAGASGFTGGHLLDALLEAPDFARVFAVTRRPLTREHSRLANRIVQFDKLESQLQGVQCDTAFCCIGSTRRAAGSEVAFRRIDFDYVLSFARAAKAAQAKRFVFLSSVRADAASTHFYLRLKGEAEAALGLLGFVSLDLLQPSLITGFRHEIRPLDLIGTILMPLANPFLTGTREPLRAIPVRRLAAAMLGAARSGRRGMRRYTYRGLLELAALKPPPPPI